LVGLVAPCGGAVEARWVQVWVQTDASACTLPSAAADVACAFMPAREPLPDLVCGVDHAELQLEILAVLEERVGRNRSRMQFGHRLDYAGGARLVLAEALARIRQRGSAFGGS